MSKAKDPIFAPVPYGDDRQVTRTRRGVDNICEMSLDITIVYCECLACNYKWELEKTDYIGGTGDSGDTDVIKNFGMGGTGNIDYYEWHEYGEYTELAHECCTGGHGLCAYPGQIIEIGQFYPLTGCTGGDGELIGDPDYTLLSYNEMTGELVGSIESPCLDTTSNIPIYKTCIGSSGDSGPNWKPRTFGGYPLVCPNCCKVNFKCYWREPLDNPGKDDVEFDVPVKIKGNWQFEQPIDRRAEIPDPYIVQDPCKSVIVTDFQRMKSDFV